MSKDKEDIGLLIKEETERRLEEMGSENYEFPAKIGRGDIIAIVLMIVISMILIVLCMVGVID